MKLTTLNLLAGLLYLSQAQAAWVWSDWGDVNNPTGTSGSTLMTPVYANYEFANNQNEYGWDKDPEPFHLAWSASTSVELDLQVRSGSASIEYLEIQPVDTAVTSYDITFTLTFPYGIITRGDSFVVGGGLGFLLNPVGLTIDNATLDVFDATNTQLALNQSSPYAMYGALTNATGNTGDFGNVGEGWHGLNGGGVNHSTYFPWPDLMGGAVDPTKAVGSLTWTLTGVNQDNTTDVLRMSFDGGVPLESPVPTQYTQVIPEPTSYALIGLAALGLISRRRR